MLHVHATENTKLFFCQSRSFHSRQADLMFCQFMSFSAVFFYERNRLALRSAHTRDILQKHEAAIFCDDNFVVVVCFSVFGFRVSFPSWVRASWIESGTKWRQTVPETSQHLLRVHQLTYLQGCCLPGAQQPGTPKKMIWAPTVSAAAPNTLPVGLLTYRLLPF